MHQALEASFSKVKDLSPSSKQVNLLAKVVIVGERRTIDPTSGGPRTLREAIVGDETGTVVLSLGEGQIGLAGTGDVLQVHNGYVSLVLGHIRLNVGEQGSLEAVAREIPEVNLGNNLSAAEHEAQPLESGRRIDGGRPGGGGRSFGREERSRDGRRRF